MAWTIPRTWTGGELDAKALMDVHVRDNFNAILPIHRVRKTADESLTSNTVLQNDDHLVFPVAMAASERWHVEVFLFYTAATTGDLKLAWTTTAGAMSGNHAAMGAGSATAGPPADSFYFNAGITPGSIHSLGGYGTGTIACAILVADWTTGSSATPQLQWAQLNSDATATTVKAGSTLIAYRVA